MPYETLRHAGRKLSRWIPENAIEVTGEYGVVYVYRENDRLLAIGYAGNAGKSSFHFAYKSMADVDQKICAFFDNLNDWKARKQQCRKDSYKPHTFQVGEIITNSWGYDQTNVDWYVVTRKTEHFVWLRPICAQLIEDEGCGPMSGRESPVIGTDLKPVFTEKGEETKHKASGDYVSMKFGCGSRFTGGSQYTSWYA
jgi:hypothetical protein